MCIPLLGWTILGIIPTKYINRIVDKGTIRGEKPKVKQEEKKPDNFASFVKK
jgi:hypothetical protein